jgi:hypothetical protein
MSGYGHGHGHDHVYGHDLPRLSLDLGAILGLVKPPLGFPALWC